MGFFSSRIELDQKIKSQEQEIKNLLSECSYHKSEIERLQSECGNLKERIKDYEQKYVNTQCECDFCYTTLQANYLYCPKCGKKVKKESNDEIYIRSYRYKSPFQVENDLGGVLITGYTGFNDKKITIPSAIDGKPVIGVWNEVFKNCTELQEVYFEEGCRYICNSVFEDCKSLQKVRLPKSLKEIGRKAFANCGSIKELAIPPNVDTIGEYAFWSCRELKKIYLPNKLRAISGCMLSNTSISEIEIPESVMHIGHSAFSDTKIKEIVLHRNIKSIDSYAFEIQSLEKITIPSDVKIIASNVFGRIPSTRLKVLCAAGSKMQFYARKHGLNAIEIPPQPSTNPMQYVKGVWVESGIVPRNGTIMDWCDLPGISKASTWPFELHGRLALSFEKPMEPQEALHIMSNITRSLCRNGNVDPKYYNPFKIYTSENWGTSEV